jgi:hypothetical protein
MNMARRMRKRSVAETARLLWDFRMRTWEKGVEFGREMERRNPTPLWMRGR